VCLQYTSWRYRITVASVMVPLVGEEGHTGNVIYDGMEDILAFPGVTPYIYGKKETRPFRKMGNVTVALQPHKQIEIAIQ
jgi:phosphoribosylaminoimidazole carboxylase (NCAIR synthetase)